MGRKNTIETLKRDNLIIQILLRHKGRDNAIDYRGLTKEVSANGFELKEASVHTIIARIKFERNVPICSLDSGGYYWAKNKQDVLESINHLQKKVDGLNEHIEFYKNFLID